MSEKADKSLCLKDAHMPSVTPHGRNIMYRGDVLLTAVNEDVAVIVAQNLNAHNDLLAACRWFRKHAMYYSDGEIKGEKMYKKHNATIAKATQEPATPRNPPDVQPVDDTGDRATGNG